jgi:hypothetical protein
MIDRCKVDEPADTVIGPYHRAKCWLADGAEARLSANGRVDLNMAR